jgi:hypothetical protein
MYEEYASADNRTCKRRDELHTQEKGSRSILFLSSHRLMYFFRIHCPNSILTHPPSDFTSIVNKWPLLSIGCTLFLLFL